MSDDEGPSSAARSSDDGDGGTGDGDATAQPQEPTVVTIHCHPALPNLPLSLLARHSALPEWSSVSQSASRAKWTGRGGRLADAESVQPTSFFAARCSIEQASRVETSSSRGAGSLLPLTPTRAAGAGAPPAPLPSLCSRRLQMRQRLSSLAPPSSCNHCAAVILSCSMHDCSIILTSARCCCAIPLPSRCSLCQSTPPLHRR